MTCTHYHSIQSINTSQSSMRTDGVSIATSHRVIKQFQDTAINQAMWDLRPNSGTALAIGNHAVYMCE